VNNVKGLVRLGLLSPDPHPFLHEQGPPISWRSLLCQLLGVPTDMFYDNLLELMAERLGSQERVKAIVDLGLCSESQVEKLGSPLNTLSHHLAKVLRYDPGERDMLLLRHDITIK